MNKLLLLALFLGVNGSIAFAVPLCTSVVANAADFQGLGNGGCQFGDKIFYGFSYSDTLTDSSGNPLPSNVAASAVAVSFSNLGGAPWAPVVSFISNWDVINGQQGDVRISYSVLAAPTAPMFSASMTLSGFVSNVDPANQFNSVISGNETVCCPGSGSVTIAPALVPGPNPSGLVFESAADTAFFVPTIQLSFSKDIFLDAGTDSGVPGGPPNGNEATLTRIDEGLLESVPEPLSFLLLGSGLISMVFLMKQVRNWKERSEGRQ